MIIQLLIIFREIDDPVDCHVEEVTSYPLIYMYLKVNFDILTKKEKWLLCHL